MNHFNSIFSNSIPVGTTQTHPSGNHTNLPSVIFHYQGQPLGEKGQEIISSGKKTAVA